MRKLYEAIRALKDSPQRGRPGTEEGTREIFFPPMPYVAVYRMTERTIEILRTLPHRAEPDLKFSLQTKGWGTVRGLVGLS